MWEQIYDYVYDDSDKYNFVFVDKNLRVSSTNGYFKKFHGLLFD